MLLADALRRISRQIKRLLPHDGNGGDDSDSAPRDTLARRDPAFAALLRNAMLGRQSVERDGTLRVPALPGAVQIKPHGRNCATAAGFSLHANTRVGAKARAGLEKLAKYLCRPALAAHRIERVDATNIRISLKNEWRGGATQACCPSQNESS